MVEIIIDDMMLDNNNKVWDKCCFYTGTLAVIIAIGTVVLVLINQNSPFNKNN
tara:strand:+ start:111 stop:269 length:159 start_codon:yes stop_codon:yes gene_type:complete